jgi:hypothetical protein
MKMKESPVNGASVKKFGATILLLAQLFAANLFGAFPGNNDSGPQQADSPPAGEIIYPKNNEILSFKTIGYLQQVNIPVLLKASGTSIWALKKVTFQLEEDNGSIICLDCEGERKDGENYGIVLSASRAGRYNLTASVYYDDLRTLNIVDLQEKKVKITFVIATAAERPPTLNDNGIVVGDSKVFDERSLRSRLQDTIARFGNPNFVNPESLASRIGSFQGATLDTTAFALNATTTPVPGITTTNNTGQTTTTGSVVTQGVLTGSSPPPQGTSTTTNVVSPNTTTTVITQPQVTPAAPSLPAQTSGFSFQPPFGLSAQTLLAEQVSLTYDAINYGLLLEGAISDRVMNSPGPVGALGQDIRQRAVVGFQVTVNPFERYKKHLAEVEITIKNKDPLSQAPSLVSLMPKEKTYNVATISKNARQFGFGAVIQPLNVGASFSSTKESLYLIRDNDTVALEKVQAGNSVSFSWQFRPVLGRKTVEPGTKQVYAVLALPTAIGFPYEGEVSVKTRWREYNSKTGEVGDVEKGSENVQSVTRLSVNNISADPMRPIVQSVFWDDLGQGKILVTATGRNFLPGSSVIVGNDILTRPENGLVIPDENDLRFIVSADKVALMRDVLMFGRFGTPAEIKNDIVNQFPKNDGWGIKLSGDPAVKQVDAQNSIVKISLKSKKDTFPDSLLGDYIKPLIIIGNKIFGLSDAPVSTVFPNCAATPASCSEGVTLSFKVPTQLLTDTGKLTVKYPFWGPDFVAESPVSVERSFSASKISVLSTDGTNTQLIVSGTLFDKNTIEIHVGNEIYKDNKFEFLSDKLIKLDTRLSLKQLEQVNQVIVRQDVGGNKVNILLPLTVSAKPSPKVLVLTQEPIGQGDSKVIKLQGANFGSISSIIFEGQPVNFELDDDGATLKLSITSFLTISPGEKELQFILKDGKSVSYKLRVSAR